MKTRRVSFDSSTPPANRFGLSPFGIYMRDILKNGSILSLCVKTTINPSSRKVPETYRPRTSSTTAHLTQQRHFLEPEKATVNPPIKNGFRSPYLIVKRVKQNTSP
ncbi:hypothetical protein CEXT_109311 [Caerostris extrusa]|uniref:Uncharacterized protein n=1 Tax=Caerostris extrusa TaxID=172846 RepID=A0AAV4X6N4_CAEEX|nr:hypothetical protein CEXT_109311 [Caerostris extrusa]